MWNRRTSLTLPALLAVTAFAAGCDRNEAGSLTAPGEEPVYAAIDSTFATSTNRFFTQVERLGNPAEQELFVEKREHATFDTFGPDRDPGHFTDDIEDFVTTVAGRPAAVGTAIAQVLLGQVNNDPGDKIRAFTTRAPGVTANIANDRTNQAGRVVGWLTQVTQPGTGYGGRTVTEDVVDIGLAVTFGSVLSSVNVSPGLITDNVDSNDRAVLNTFPYFPTPNAASDIRR